jgi:hypothetical protein
MPHRDGKEFPMVSNLFYAADVVVLSNSLSRIRNVWTGKAVPYIPL